MEYTILCHSKFKKIVLNTNRLTFDDISIKINILSLENYDKFI